MDKLGTISGDYIISGLKGIFNQKKIFIVKCVKCGNERELQYAEFIRLKNKHSVKNCGLNYMKSEVGLKYGDFIIESFTNDFKYNVKCLICGKTKVLNFNEINTSKRVSHKYCSNGDDDKTIEWKKFHSIWTSMRTRTSNVNSKFFKHYGGRGILSNDYVNFMDFKIDLYNEFLSAINKFGFREVSIDRIDNNKSYEKSNIRFTDKKTQARNTRRIKDITAINPNGDCFEITVIKDFAIENNLCGSSISLCLKGRQGNHKGWIFRYK